MARHVVDPLAAKRLELFDLLTERHEARSRGRNALEFLNRPAPRLSDINQMPEGLVDQLIRRNQPVSGGRPRYCW
jgi:hypothetical protein